MFKELTVSAAFACLSLSAGEIKILTGDPNTTSRTVSYHQTDISPIAAEAGFTTMIYLPKEETILEVTCGDKENWPVNWTGNLAYLKPAKIGSRTNLNLITASGNVYSFIASEITGNATAHADLKVFVTPADGTALAAMKDKPRFVSADAVEGYKKAAETAQQELRDETAALEKKMNTEKAEREAALPGSIRHDYRYNLPPKSPFGVTAIYHDDKFTYIEAALQEAPAIYEVKDGKASLLQFELKGGRYIVPKILDEGYLRVGKSELKFHRETL
jgi:type IV secretory pathway VirB9-like protein